MMSSPRERDTASGDLLQPLVGVGMKAKAEQVDAELHCGRDLVYVLPAGAGRGKEALAQRLFRNLHVLRPHLATRQNNREPAQ